MGLTHGFGRCAVHPSSLNARPTLGTLQTPALISLPPFSFPPTPPLPPTWVVSKHVLPVQQVAREPGPQRRHGSPRHDHEQRHARSLSEQPRLHVEAHHLDVHKPAVRSQAVRRPAVGAAGA